MSKKELSKSLAIQIRDMKKQLEYFENRYTGYNCSVNANKKTNKALKQLKKAKKNIKKAIDNMFIGYEFVPNEPINKKHSINDNQDTNNDATIKTVYNHRKTKNKPD